MAITLALQQNTYTDDCTQGTINDITADYGTGGNPDRVDLDIFIFIEKINLETGNGNILPNSYSIGSDTSFTFPLGEDGWYKFKAIAAERWDIATSYTINQVISRSETLYICTTDNTGEDPVSTTGFWEEPSDAQIILITENPATYSTNAVVLDKIVICYSQVCFEDMVINQSINGCMCDPKNNSFIDKMEVELNAARIADAQSKFMQGEKSVRAMNDICQNFECDEC